MIDWIAWDSLEFKKASHVFGDSFSDPYAWYARLYYAPFWCDMRNSSDENANSCPYYACYAQHDFASPRANTDVVLTLPDSSFPLAQCTGFEVDEPFQYVTRLSRASACLDSKGTFDRVHDLARTPSEGAL